MARAFVLALGLLLAACTGARSVRAGSPVQAPATASHPESARVPEDAERKRVSAQPQEAERKRVSAQPQEAERKRVSAQPQETAKLERFQKDFRRFVNSGQLEAAEADLNEAQISGLDQGIYTKCMEELSDRRAEARRLIAEGDEFFREERYKQARRRYQEAHKIDRDNSLAVSKIANAERFEHEAHVRDVQETLSFVVPVATQVLGDYLEFKRQEEERKREEARRAEEARQKQQQGEQRNRGRRH